MGHDSGLDRILKPASVAVVGVSRGEAGLGHRIMNSLVFNKFAGPVYPVNKNASSVGSLRAYKSVTAIPDRIDLAAICVPAKDVLKVAAECARKHVKGLVVITAGFAEAGAEGARLQERLLRLVHKHKMRMIGPNCMGVINTAPSVRLAASFSPIYPGHGPVAMASQSGALGLAILDLAAKLDIGLSQFVSMGNKADASGNDLIEYWSNDPDTKVILLYLESFGNPRRFARIAGRINRIKPIIAVKSGRTAAGVRAAGSHTAALASSDVIVDALFKKTGVLRAGAIEEMFDLALMLSTQPLPRGNRVAILTNAGGPAILCADSCEAAGVVVTKFSARTLLLLRKAVPGAASITNPVDMIASASASDYSKVIDTLLSAGEVDSLIIICIPLTRDGAGPFVRGIKDGIARGRARGGRAASKPVLMCLMSGDGGRKPLGVGTERIPIYPFPESIGNVLGKVYEYSIWRSKGKEPIVKLDGIDRTKARKITLPYKKDGDWLSAGDARGLLKAYGLPVPAGGVAKNANEAVKFASTIGYPVALKLSSRTIIHKTEFGGVALDVGNSDGVRQAFEAIERSLERHGERATMDGVLVQPMISGGVEVMAGVVNDPLFGPLISFGLGGIHVEILRDVSFRAAPLTEREANEMTSEIRGYKLLRGYRGHPAADVESICDVLLRLSRLVEDIPRISEIDLNPIIALPPSRGCFIVDARVRLRPA